METAGNLIRDHIPENSQKELVLALESARTRLSVAIALETKSTPRDRWRYYLETAERVSLFIKKLRNADLDSMTASQGWTCALDMLNRLPAQSKALRLCEILRAVVMKLE
jgi:hypothetical protein